MNQQERIHQLLDQVLTQQADAGTFAELQRLLREDPEGVQAAEIAAILEASGHTELPAYDRAQGDVLVDRILMADRPAPVRVVRFRYGWVAAAVLLLVTAGAAFMLLKRPSTHAPVLTHNTTTTPADAQPGSSKATLTLADGTVVTLDSLGNQVLQQGAVNIRQQGGMLAYDAQSTNATVGYNTLKTPRGGQFRLALPDGTSVWLNAASSLRYPTIFNGKERMVEVTGEAYFEVAKNTAQPFRVKVNNSAMVEVLGTHFNIHAYDDEPSMHATLLEGSVRITKGAGTAILKPGQQARVGESIQVVNAASLEQVVAWKNGLFDFNNAGLKDVMQQLARWYDIDIEYKGQVPNVEFWGKVGRNLTLAQVLKGLEGAGVHFEIKDNGKKLVVLP